MKRFSLLLILIISLSGIITYAQGLTRVEPAEAIQGDSLTVTISGQGNNFMQSSMFNIFFSQGSPVFYTLWGFNNQVVNDDTLRSDLFIPFGAATGTYGLLVSTYHPLYEQWEFNDALTITENPDPPRLLAVDPDTITERDILEVTISGHNTHFA